MLKYPYEVLITFPNIIIECLRDLDCPGGHVCLNNKCMKGTLHLWKIFYKLSFVLKHRHLLPNVYISELDVSCPSLQDVQLGTSRCNGPELTASWDENEWRDGDACRDKCNEYYQRMGSGCCEARIRGGGSSSYCRFYIEGELITGFGDSKAKLCPDNYCTRLNYYI